tara:strand:+ start:25410 stop:26006 length:597 start_codon:yes stop_codon:yes gene_type:complete
MPPRNNPVPNAVRLFNCTICDKGYPRQVDYENHLRSYDHNHRQRLADMKKLTASNDPEGNKPKQGLEMRSINVEEAGKKMAAGGRFTKIGGAAPAGGGRFKKVGVAVGASVDEKKEDVVAEAGKAEGTVDVVNAVPEKEEEAQTSEDAVLVEEDEDEEDEEDAITWEEYDFTKPTGCDHETCDGCKTDGIWSGEWVAV